MIVTARAVAGLERCRRFLASRNPSASRNASTAILQAFARLAEHPDIGRPVPTAVELRELTIPFGDGGYVALYRHEAAEDRVLLLAFRHQRETGY